MITAPTLSSGRFSLGEDRVEVDGANPSESRLEGETRRLVTVAVFEPGPGRLHRVPPSLKQFMRQLLAQLLRFPPGRAVAQ